MKFIAPLFTFILASCSLLAQELNVQVTINTPKLQTADPKVFESLETAIQEFYNNRKWTEDIFEQEERINCIIQLTITEELSTNSFKADLAIQAVRPVYGSDYETAILNHVDRDVQFVYEQFQPLEFSKNIFNDNLTSILAFYAYVILGLDYDTYSLYGGDNHFQTAQDIINTIPPDAPSGWRSLDSNRNRYWIMENMLNPRVRPLRQAMYDYHRLGLDIMHQGPEEGKVVLASALDKAFQVNQDYPSSMIIQMFTNSKSKEIIEVFKQATQKQKSAVYTTMIKIDASHASQYRVLRR